MLQWPFMSRWILGCWLAGLQSREAILTSLLTADQWWAKNRPVGSYCSLMATISDSFPPIGRLPMALKEVAFGRLSAGRRCHAQVPPKHGVHELASIHERLTRFRVLLTCGSRRIMRANAMGPVQRPPQDRTILGTCEIVLQCDLSARPGAFHESALHSGEKVRPGGMRVHRSATWRATHCFVYAVAAPSGSPSPEPKCLAR